MIKPFDSEFERYFEEAIADGVRAADAGQVIEHEAVVAWVASWGTPDEKPMPTCD